MPETEDLLKWAREYTANRYPRHPMPAVYVNVAALADALEKAEEKIKFLEEQEGGLRDDIGNLEREKEGAFEAGFDRGVSEAHKRLRDYVQEDGMIDQHALIKHPQYDPKFYPGDE